MVAIGGAVSRRALDPVFRLIACCWPQESDRQPAHGHILTVEQSDSINASALRALPETLSKFECALWCVRRFGSTRGDIEEMTLDTAQRALGTHQCVRRSNRFERAIRLAKPNTRERKRRLRRETLWMIAAKFALYKRHGAFSDHNGLGEALRVDEKRGEVRIVGECNSA